jgi:hypothetical protein
MRSPVSLCIFCDRPQLLPCCARWDTVKWNSLGLITSQGSLGSYLHCLCRDKCFSSKQNKQKTEPNRHMFLTSWLRVFCFFPPWCVCVCVFSLHGVCVCVCVCVCVFSLHGVCVCVCFPSILCVCVCVCVRTLVVEEPVPQGNQCSSHSNNNAIKFCWTGIAFFAWAFSYPAD